MSLRNRPVRRGLVAGFAVALLGSVLALGCVQGPKGAFNRVWGTDGIAAKTTKNLKSMVRRDNKEKEDGDKQELAEKKRAKKDKGAILQASGVKPDGKKPDTAGRTWITKPAELASSLSNGIIAAPFVQKRAPKGSEVQDPFLGEIGGNQVAKKSSPGKPAAAAPGTRPVNTFAPGFNTQMAQLKADASREKAAAATMLAQAAAAKKATAQAQALALAQAEAMAKARAARPKASLPKVESPESVAARLEIASLLKQARAADQHGHLNRAMELAHSAEQLAQMHALQMGPDGNRPEDVLQRLREKQFAIENSAKIAALVAPSSEQAGHSELAQLDPAAVDAPRSVRKQPAPRKQPTVSVASQEFAEEAGNGAVRHAHDFGAELADEFSVERRSTRRADVHRPQQEHQTAKPQSLTSLLPEGGWQPAELEDRQPQVPRAATSRVIVASSAANQDMIVDTLSIAWRFPPRRRLFPAAVEQPDTNFTERMHTVPQPREHQVFPEESHTTSVRKAGRETAKASANGGAKLASYTGRVRSNRASVVPTSGQSVGTRNAVREPVAKSASRGLLQTTAEWKSTDEVKPSARGHIISGVNLSKEPGLLGAADEKSPAEDDVVEQQSTDNDGVQGTPNVKPLSGRSFSTILGIAVACVVGIAIWRRFQMANIRS